MPARCAFARQIARPAQCRMKLEPRRSPIAQFCKSEGKNRMRKPVPDTMFSDREPVRLSALSTWVLDHGVTEIVMTERQFWKFVTIQPAAEKPWTTFMGRSLSVPDMPESSQRCLGLFNK